MAINVKMNRREFLCYSSAGIISGYGSTLMGASLFENNPSFTTVSASSNNLGEYFLTALNDKNHILFQHQLPFRGHAVAISHRHQRIFCISRRPKSTINIVDFSGNLAQHITIPPERHLYGHAICDNSGEYLYTTENNIRDGSGRISIWDIRNQTTLLTTLSSYGIGPHDITLSHDQQYLIVANGGIHTHPQSGRKKLNLDTMSPSLVFIDRFTGKLHKYLQLPPHCQHNSIRHLAMDFQGNVFIALQNQLKSNPNEVLLARYDKKESRLIPLQVPAHLATRLQGYIGSIAIDHSQSIIGATSPRGNCVLFYSVSGDFLYHLDSRDVCGIQAGNTAGEFIFSNGKGEIIHCLASKTLSTLSTQQCKNIYWDNHLSLI
jgi:hypothetical protein